MWRMHQEPKIPTFHHPWHVDFADTDAGGVVYHARYLEWAERARAAMLRELGWSNAALQQQGIVFAVHTLTAHYHRPARLDDALSIRTTVCTAHGARLQVMHHIMKNDENLVTLDVTLACTTTTGKPRRLPQALFAHQA